MQYGILLLIGFAAFDNGQIDFSRIYSCDITAKIGELEACHMRLVEPAITAITLSKEITKENLCRIPKASLDCLTEIGCLTPEARDLMDLNPHLKKVGVDCDSDERNSEVLVNFASCIDSDTSEQISECLASLTEMIQRLRDRKLTVEMEKKHGCKFAKHAFSCVKGCVKINSNYDISGAVLKSLKAQGYECD